MGLHQLVKICNCVSPINNAIKGLQMTRVIVAHRPDTIAMASRRIVLDDGEIVIDINDEPKTEEV